MKYTREIMNVNGRSLVEVYSKGDFEEYTNEYVVCRNYNPKKRVGDQWDNGTYFTIYNSNEKEEKLIAATNCLLGNVDEEIKYSRLLSLATDMAKGHLDCDKESAMEFFDMLDLSDEERQVLGIPSNKKYKIVEVQYTKTIHLNKYVVIEQDTSKYEADEYVDEYNGDWDGNPDDEDWEVDDYNVISEDLTEDEIKEHENYYELDNDIEDLD